MQAVAVTRNGDDMADLIFMSDPSAQQSVRNLVQVGMTSAVLSDDQLMDDAIGGASEAYILGLVTDVTAMSSDEQARVRLAVIYETAATVIESMPMVTSERHGDEMQVSVSRVDTMKRIAALRVKSQGFLTGLLIPATASASLSFFETVPALRSRGF